MTIKSLLLSLAFLLVATPAFAAKVECPATITQSGKSFPLKGMNLYDGDPKENADLAPDFQGKNRNVWKLKGLKDGRSYNLVCRYDGTIAVQSFTLDKLASKCVQLHGTKSRVACK